MIKRALISVYDKSGLDEFAQGLVDLGAEIVSSGGTSTYLEEMGIPVTRIEEITQVPELLGGRVKTLHPRIHAAILARRDEPDDLSALEEQEIQPLDLVCVNLYPFRETVAKHGVREEDAVEVIDIGGPAMLRAAAKNFAHVVPVSRGPQYERVLEELRNGGELSLETRRELAAEAFSVTAAYEASIAAWFMDRTTFPRPADPGFRESTRPLLWREPAPARGLLRGDRRPAPPALAGRAAARSRALVQQPQRPERGATLPA